MTRMAYLPESMRISAFLIKTPASLSMLYKLLPLEMDDILNFIAATHAIDYLHFELPAETRGLEETASQRPAAAVLERPAQPDHEVDREADASPQAEQARGGGLLQRLMGRLRGK